MDNIFRMSLKRAILDVVTSDRLSSIAEALEVPAETGDVRQRLQKSARIEARDVLLMLDDKEVAAACEQFRVHSAGRREDIIGRLLEVEAYRDSGSEVALYDLGAFVAVAVEKTSEGDHRIVYCTVAQRTVGEMVEVNIPKGDLEAGVCKRGLSRFVRACSEVGFVAALSAPKTKAHLNRLFEAAGLDTPAREMQCTSTLSTRVFGDGQQVLDERAVAMGAEERMKKAALAVVRAREAVRTLHLGRK